MQNRCYQLIALFTLAQLVILLVFGYTPYPDSQGYIMLARESLLSGQPYPVTEQLNSYPFLWNIGSINLVQLSLALTGSVVPLQVVYALLKGLSCLLVYHIALRLSSQPRLALTALLLYVCYPANYGESTSVLGEVPFICLSLLAVWLCVARRRFLLAGMVLAVAAWIRPFSIVFIAALLVCYFRQWRLCLRLLAGYGLMVVLIGSLNYARTGLFLYQAKTGWMALTDYTYDTAPDHAGFTADPRSVRNDTTLNVAEKDAAWRTMFLEWLARHPAEYVRQMPRKLVDTYVSDNANLCAFLPQKAQRDYMYGELSMGTLVHSLPRLSAVQWLTVVNLLFYYLLLLTALLALFSFSRNTHLLPVAVILMGTLMLLLVGHGEARFHQPFMPFVIILSASFIQRWKE